MSAEWQNQFNFPNDIFPSPGIKVVYRLGNYPITESVKQTQSLAGATFVQADKVEYQGKIAILFAFSVRLLFSSLAIMFDSISRI
jgi:hypothetical protein